MTSDDHTVMTLRLFPLSGVVMFPHTLVPLHVFEPRYRQMTEHALAHDRRIGIVMPVEEKIVAGADGFLSNRTPLHAVGSMGRIANETRLPDGRFTFVLKGEQRFRILEELTADTLYRQARVEPLIDEMSSRLTSRRQIQRAEIMALLQALLPRENEFVEQFLSYLTLQCPSPIFTDIVAHAAPLSATDKQRLLELINADERLHRLTLLLKEKVGVRERPREFPPAFATN
jgi:Lon protease-like protein